MTATTIFNPSTVQFERIPRVIYNEKPKLASFTNTLKIVSQSGDQNRNGESGTSLDPGSRTTRENNDLSDDLQFTHCPYRLILLEKITGKDIRKPKIG